MHDLKGGTTTLSVRVPRDIARKVQKVAEATGTNVGDVFVLFLQKGCKQPTTQKKHPPA